MDTIRLITPTMLHEDVAKAYLKELRETATPINGAGGSTDTNTIPNGSENWRMIRMVRRMRIGCPRTHSLPCGSRTGILSA